MRKEFLQNVAGLFLVSFCYINVITSFWDKCLNKWEENHDLFSKVIGTRCMKVIGQTQENHFKSFLQILVKSAGWTNSLLLSSLWMQKKKSQKVQLSMSLCASASTLYFGKFWYWCIILDHLPNVVYIYIPNILNLADRPSIDPMPILALALILSIFGSLHPPVAPTSSIQENQHLHSQLTWC